MHWTPSASIDSLKKRAKLIQNIREFFIARNLLEVETPLMCHTSVTDPFIESIPATFVSDRKAERYYLQTSPEYMMKRLLAAGSGSIFQICKAFRQGEIGQQHNPEFTMLEWYRVDFDHHQLMDEMDELLQSILSCPKAKRYTYQALFLDFLAINPHTASLDELRNCAISKKIDVADTISDPDTWLQLLLSHYIEPNMQHGTPYFLYDFPASQSALARIQNTNPAVASRFEVYMNGIELANGFHELQDANEQRKRFEKNLCDRKIRNLDLLPIDEHFLASLEAGLPNCSGVALGIDRLSMIALKQEAIKQVVSFDFTKA